MKIDAILRRPGTSQITRWAGSLRVKIAPRLPNRWWSGIYGPGLRSVLRRAYYHATSDNMSETRSGFTAEYWWAPCPHQIGSAASGMVNAITRQVRRLLFCLRICTINLIYRMLSDVWLLPIMKHLHGVRLLTVTYEINDFLITTYER